MIRVFFTGFSLVSLFQLKDFFPSYLAFGFPLLFFFRLKDFSLVTQLRFSSSVYLWIKKFFSLKFHIHNFPPQSPTEVGDFFTRIARHSSVLCSGKFATKKNGNYNSIFQFNILLITMLGFVNNHMTPIRSDNVYTNWTENCFQAISCHSLYMSIVINLADLSI